MPSGTKGVGSVKIIAVDDEISALHVILNETIELGEVDCRFFKDNVSMITAYIAANRVDAAFLDVNMPNINGLELAERLVAISPEIKLVFITGLAIDADDLSPSVRARTIGFLYKPYDRAELLRYLDEIGGHVRTMTVKTFGSFDCFVDDKMVAFSSGKSKELFALLIAYNGKSLSMGDAISQIWPDHEVQKAKKLYRDAVWRLRKTLRDVDFNCVTFNRANLLLDKSNISCDVWEYIAGERNDYGGEFLKSYEWSIPYQLRLDTLKR